jgi:hypothetical protein
VNITTIQYHLNLYLVSQEANNDWDTWDSFVIAAPDEATARNANPRDGTPMDWSIRNDSWASKPEEVTCKLIGEATLGTKPGIICASFNAG